MVLEAKVEFRIVKGYVIGEPYDYGSVMHYGFNFFSVDSKRPVIVKLMPGGKQMGQRDGFSDLDLRKINKLYNCTKYISECSLLVLVRDFFLTICTHHQLYFIIFTESIQTHKIEIIRIVSGMRNIMEIGRCIYYKPRPCPSAVSLVYACASLLSYNLVLAGDLFVFFSSGTFNLEVL